LLYYGIWKRAKKEKKARPLILNKQPHLTIASGDIAWYFKYMVKLQPKDENEIYRLRKLFPHSIAVRVRRSEDGGFFAEILTFKRVITEADTFSELIEMVNDAVMTYLEIPKEYISYMPSYIPPLEVAQEFGIFPTFEKEKEINLPLAVGV
jgi:predicted RNase H-like HicB family nuclease